MYISFVFFFNDTATTEIYTLSLHDALPICRDPAPPRGPAFGRAARRPGARDRPARLRDRDRDVLRARDGGLLDLRSEEHTSELQSRQYLVCRLLLEKKKDTRHRAAHSQSTS